MPERLLPMSGANVSYDRPNPFFDIATRTRVLHISHRCPNANADAHTETKEIFFVGAQAVGQSFRHAVENARRPRAQSSYGCGSTAINAYTETNSETEIKSNTSAIRCAQIADSDSDTGRQ
jgi:hypothetical protein